MNVLGSSWFLITACIINFFCLALINIVSVYSEKKILICGLSVSSIKKKTEYIIGVSMTLAITIAIVGIIQQDKLEEENIKYKNSYCVLRDYAKENIPIHISTTDSLMHHFVNYLRIYKEDLRKADSVYIALEKNFSSFNSNSPEKKQPETISFTGKILHKSDKTPYTSLQILLLSEGLILNGPVYTNENGEFKIKCQILSSIGMAPQFGVYDSINGKRLYKFQKSNNNIQIEL